MMPYFLASSQPGHHPLALLQPVLHALGLPLEAGHFLLGLPGAVGVALLHERADGCRKLLEYRGVGVAFLLQTPPLGVHFKYLGYHRAAVEALHGESADHEFRVGLYGL